MSSPVGVLSSEGYSSYTVTVEQLSHGLTVSSSSTSSRMGRSTYVIHAYDADFTIRTVWTSYAAFSAFGKWLSDYAMAVADGSAKMMRVRYPARNFDKFGIPSQVSFGDASGRYVYRMDISFSAPIDASEGWANFSQAFGTSVDPEVNKMVPFGFQLTGDDPGVWRSPIQQAIIDNLEEQEAAEQAEAVGGALQPGIDNVIDTTFPWIR